MAGKGDKPRPVDRKKWDACPLWKKKRKPRSVVVDFLIEELNKQEVDGE